MRPTIHTFETTADAYDFVQCYDTIKEGDLLHIPAEGVVGVAETWPFAVTAAHGELHTLKPGAQNLQRPSIQRGLAPACQLAIELGYPLADQLTPKQRWRVMLDFGLQYATVYVLAWDAHHADQVAEALTDTPCVAISRAMVGPGPVDARDAIQVYGWHEGTP